MPSYNNSIIQQTNLKSNSFKKICSPLELLHSSILGTLKTLSFIFSYTIIFSLIPTIILYNIKLPKMLQAIIVGIFEISSGINNIYSLDISLNYKLTITSFILSFSSLMVIIQIFSFVFKAKVKFKDLIKFKLLQGIISAAITYIIVRYIHYPTISVFISNDKFISKCDILPSTTYMFSIIITIILCLILFRKKRQEKPVA